MSTIPIEQQTYAGEWRLPSRGMVGMLALIAAESAIFTIFVVAYIYYSGRPNLHPSPRQVLEVPIAMTLCLLSSSIFIWLAEREISRGEVKRFLVFWAVTWMLGLIFLVGTGFEWHDLIYDKGLSVGTNVFGTAFYSLVGLHATHVVVGLIMIFIVLALAIADKVGPKHAERIKVLSLYWHFVDGVWVVVFTTVYIAMR